MTVAFNRTPTNIRVPLFYAEVNAGLSFYQGNSKLLLIGQMLAAGTAAANAPVLVSAAPTQFGEGSMLAEMCMVAKRQNAIGEIWALPLSDPAGVKQTKTITVSANPPAGTAVIYINDQKVTCAVLSGDTNATVATNLAAAINLGYTGKDGIGHKFPLVATVATNVITLTAAHIGTLGAYLSVEKDLVGDEGALAGYLTIASVTAGTGVPSLSAGLAALGDLEFDFIAMPYADTTSLNAMRDFLADAGGRWDPMSQLYGHCFTVNFGNLSAQTTLGTGRNDPHVTIMAVQNSPSPPWQWAAALAAQHLLHKNLGADLSQAGEISRPMQRLQLIDILPPKLKASYWARSDRQTLYYDGISAFTVTTDGRVLLDRVVTTYQLNAWNDPDPTWLDVETIFQTVYAVRFMRHQILAKHPRDALVPDNPRGLQGFTTPDDLKGDVIHAYQLLVNAGVMKNLDLFVKNVIVEQAADPNRVNAYIPLDVANQLRVFAANVETALNRANV